MNENEEMISVTFLNGKSFAVRRAKLTSFLESHFSFMSPEISHGLSRDTSMSALSYTFGTGSAPSMRTIK